MTTEGVTDGLDMETDRLLYDDGKMWPLRPPKEKTQGRRRVEGRAALGPDARSHIRQEGRGGSRGEDARRCGRGVWRKTPLFDRLVRFDPNVVRVAEATVR